MDFPIPLCSLTKHVWPLPSSRTNIERTAAIEMVAFTLTRSTPARNTWRFHQQAEHHAGAAYLSVTPTCAEPATAEVHFASPLLEVPRWPDEGHTFAACSGLCVEILVGGEGGAHPQSGDTVQIQYACLLATSGCCVDASRSKMFSGRGPLTIKLGSKQVVHGMEIGLCALTLGSLARLHVPPDFAYGELGSGPIPPSAHLVFEVELLGINDRQTSTRNSWLLRRLLMLPPPADLTERAARLPGMPPVNMPLRYHASSPPEMQLPLLLVNQPERARAAAAAAAAEDERRFAVSDPEAIADAEPTDSPLSQLSNLEPLAQLPPWLRRLRSTQPLPTPESRSYFAFAQLHRALLPLPSRDAAAFTSPTLDSATPNGAAGAAAELSTAAGEDLGPKLIAGASPILHAPYGTAWDSLTPMVLTGERAETGWPAAAWGWSFWEREYGDQYVTCKQRAPLFDSDQTGDTLIVETSLREAMQYARTAHLSGAAEAGKAPVMYMNGWDVFEALPQLWHPDIDKLPNTTHPRTVAEYERLHAAFNLDSVGAIQAKARGLCKLFAGPIGAITRIHQDNHDAHAWLCNVRGRKLYVLCRPEDSLKVAPPRALDRGRGTQYSGRLDPLDPRDQQRARDCGLELFAAVLEPGQTILAPMGWWHYAVSLTPSLTLMCNFWDHANVHGLHDTFYLQVARALDRTRREARTSPKPGNAVPPVAEVSPSEPIQTLTPPLTYLAAHKPFVFVREAPSTAAPMLGILRTAQPFLAGAVQGGWLRSAEPFDKGRYGWALEDGSSLGGLGRLMIRAQGPADSRRLAGWRRAGAGQALNAEG